MRRSFRPIFQFAGLLLMLSGAGSSYGFDSREQAVEQRIEMNRVSGERLKLEKPSGLFLGIFSAAEIGNGEKAVILLHDLGSTPVESAVIEPLRTGLPKRGWTTLSIQLPLLEPSAEMRDYKLQLPEAVARIKSAVAHLEEEKFETIGIIGHGLGASMALGYLAEVPESNVSQAVLIGLRSDSDLLSMLESIERPLLDLYGSRDYPVVRRGAQLRRNAAAKNRFYTQFEMVPANHAFEGMNRELVVRVSGWMSKMYEKTALQAVSKQSEEVKKEEKK